MGERIDQEWLALIMEAKRMGLSLEEIRQFFQTNGCYTKTKETM